MTQMLFMLVLTAKILLQTFMITHLTLVCLFFCVIIMTLLIRVFIIVCKVSM